MSFFRGRITEVVFLVLALSLVAGEIAFAVEHCTPTRAYRRILGRVRESQVHRPELTWAPHYPNGEFPSHPTVRARSTPDEIVLQTIGEEGWLSRAGGEIRNPQGDARAVIRALGQGLAEYFHFEMRGPREMRAPAGERFTARIVDYNARAREIEAHRVQAGRAARDREIHVGFRTVHGKQPSLEFIQNTEASAVIPIDGGELASHDISFHTATILLPRRYVEAVRAHARAYLAMRARMIREFEASEFARSATAAEHLRMLLSFWDDSVAAQIDLAWGVGASLASINFRRPQATPVAILQSLGRAPEVLLGARPLYSSLTERTLGQGAMLARINSGDLSPQQHEAMRPLAAWMTSVIARETPPPRQETPEQTSARHIAAGRALVREIVDRRRFMEAVAAEAQR